MPAPAADRALASVIVPNWNGAHLIGECLESLRAQTYRPIEAIVVDGGSHDNSAELVAARFPEARLVRLPRNLGFTGNVNAGLRAAQGSWLIPFNNDAEADPDLVAALVDGLLRHPEAGMATAKVLDAGDRRTIASVGDLLHENGMASQRGNGQPDDGRFDHEEQVFGASGCATVMRRAMLEDVGLLDERLVSYLEDVDLSLRAHWRGWACLYAPAARVYHRGSSTGGGRLASYYVARNTFRVLFKGFPRTGLLRYWPKIVAAQAQRARLAALAWRGEAARATLRGMAAGWLSIPESLGARRRLMQVRRVSDDHILRLLAP